MEIEITLTVDHLPTVHLNTGLADILEALALRVGAGLIDLKNGEKAPVYSLPVDGRRKIVIGRLSVHGDVNP